MPKSIQIGTGAGYAGDRITPAVELAEYSELDYLIFECLAERTIANAQSRKLDDPKRGYSPLLEERWEAVLPRCIENNITVITNMGAANPQAALRQTVDIVTELGFENVTIASVSGSDLRERFDLLHRRTQSGEETTDYEEVAVSANAYMGIGGITDALEEDADVIITGRVADPSLFLAPMCYEFGWDQEMLTDQAQTRIGQGIVGAHLMECAGQITGGYFADPGYKDVDGLARLGFPIATVGADGGVEISKLPNTGGQITMQTCREQMLYEVHDPSTYITPDAVADFTGVDFEQIRPNKIRVSGGRATTQTETLKVSIGYEDSIIGEGQITYAGPGAVERAKLAGEVVRKRLEIRNVPIKELRIDYIGLDSLHEGKQSEGSEPYEVRLRVAGKCDNESDANEIGREVQTLYTNGPAGGGGATMNTKRVIGIVSTLVDREHVEPVLELQEV